MLSRRIVLRWSMVVMLAAIVAGCSDPYGGRKEVSGTVTLQGQPVKDGSIIFYPLDSKETQGGAQIVQGEYMMTRQNGLKPGKYLVRLTAGDGKTRAEGEQIAGPGGSTNIVSMDLIPEDWNIKSKHEVEIKPDGTNRFDFDVPNVNTAKRRR
jgi:hypothetical protein